MSLDRSAEMKAFIIDAINNNQFDKARQAFESKEISIDTMLTPGKSAVDLALKKVKTSKDPAAQFVLYLVQQHHFKHLSDFPREYMALPKFTACQEFNWLLHIYFHTNEDKYDSSRAMILGNYYRELNDTKQAHYWYQQVKYFRCDGYGSADREPFSKKIAILIAHEGQEIALTCINESADWHLKYSQNWDHIKDMYDAYLTLISTAQSEHDLSAATDGLIKFIEHTQKIAITMRNPDRSVIKDTHITKPKMVLKLNREESTSETNKPLTSFDFIQQLAETKDEGMSECNRDLLQSICRNGSLDQIVHAHKLLNKSGEYKESRYDMKSEDVQAYSEAIDLFYHPDSSINNYIRAQTLFLAITKNSRFVNKHSYSLLRYAISCLMISEKSVDEDAVNSFNKIINSSFYYSQLDHFARSEMAYHLIKLIANANKDQKTKLLEILNNQCQAELNLSNPCGTLLEEILTNLIENHYFEKEEHFNAITSKLLELIQKTFSKHLLTTAVNQLFVLATTEKQAQFVVERLFYGDSSLYSQLDVNSQTIIIESFEKSKLYKNVAIRNKVLFSIYQHNIKFGADKDDKNSIYINKLHSCDVLKDPIYWELVFKIICSSLEKTTDKKLRETNFSPVDISKDECSRETYLSQLEMLAQSTTHPQLCYKAQKHLLKQYKVNSASERAKSLKLIPNLHKAGQLDDSDACAIYVKCAEAVSEQKEPNLPEACSYYLNAAELGDLNAKLAAVRMVVKCITDTSEINKCYRDLITTALEKNNITIAIKAASDLIPTAWSKLSLEVEEIILLIFDKISEESAWEIFCFFVKYLQKPSYYIYRVSDEALLKIQGKLEIYLEYNLDYFSSFKLDRKSAKYKHLQQERDESSTIATTANMFNMSTDKIFSIFNDMITKTDSGLKSVNTSFYQDAKKNMISFLHFLITYRRSTSEQINGLFKQFGAEINVRKKYPLFKELITKAINILEAKSRKSINDINFLIKLYGYLREYNWITIAGDKATLSRKLIPLNRESVFFAETDPKMAVRNLVILAGETETHADAQKALNEVCEYICHVGKLPHIAAYAEYPPAIAALVKIYREKIIRPSGTDDKTNALCGLILRINPARSNQHYNLCFLDRYQFQVQYDAAKKHLEDPSQKSSYVNFKFLLEEIEKFKKTENFDGYRSLSPILHFSESIYYTYYASNLVEIIGFDSKTYIPERIAYYEAIIKVNQSGLPAQVQPSLEQKESKEEKEPASRKCAFTLHTGPEYGEIPGGIAVADVVSHAKVFPSLASAPDVTEEKRNEPDETQEATHPEPVLNSAEVSLVLAPPGGINPNISDQEQSRVAGDDKSPVATVSITPRKSSVSQPATLFTQKPLANLGQGLLAQTVYTKPVSDSKSKQDDEKKLSSQSTVPTATVADELQATEGRVSPHQVQDATVEGVRSDIAKLELPLQVVIATPSAAPQADQIERKRDAVEATQPINTSVVATQTDSLQIPVVELIVKDKEQAQVQTVNLSIEITCSDDDSFNYRFDCAPAAILQLLNACIDAAFPLTDDEKLSVKMECDDDATFKFKVKRQWGAEERTERITKLCNMLRVPHAINASRLFSGSACAGMTSSVEGYTSPLRQERR